MTANDLAEEKQQKTLSPVRSLICAVCGARTRGRQWHNRDTGYGLCAESAQWLTSTRGYSAAEMKDLYGMEGEHYNIAD